MDVGLKRIALCLQKDYAALPEINALEHAKKNAGCG